MTGRYGLADYPQADKTIDKRMFIPRHKIDDAIAEMEEKSEYCPYTEGLELGIEIIKKHIESEE